LAPLHEAAAMRCKEISPYGGAVAQKKGMGNSFLILLPTV